MSVTQARTVPIEEQVNVQNSLHLHPTLTTEEYMKVNNQYCAPTHSPIPIVLQRGLGAHVWDLEGKKYIDFLSAFSVVNQGHCHPRIIDAMLEQCKKLTICTSAFQNEHWPLLCQKMCRLLNYDMASAANTGTEAIELAIKISRKWGYHVKGIPPDQAKILMVAGAFHGKSLGPLSGSSYKHYTDTVGPFAPNIGPHVAGGEPIRFNRIEDIRRSFQSSGKEIAALILEIVYGYGGCLPPDREYMREVAMLCKEYNVLLVADEIQTGFGRTGKLMSYEHFGVKPDMVVLGKALTGGVYAASMVLGSKEIMTQIPPGQHSSTFAANPLASAVAIAAVDVLVDENLSERARDLGEKLGQRLATIKSPHTSTKPTGLGLFWALHVDESHSSGLVTAQRVGALARKRGLCIISADNRLRIAPPLVIDEKDLWHGIEILEGALSDVLEASI